MQLRFIIGRAGTGKTQYIIEQIAKSVTNCPVGPPVILLVPEQATFQMEYALNSYLRDGGSIRAQVLSFRRLAYRILLETGGAARVPVGELGKRMILRKLLEQYKDSLRVFGTASRRPGFTDCLARTIGELKTYLITPETLEKTCGSLNEGSSVLLRDKLADTALLYRELENYLADRYTDPDDLLTLLSEKIVHAPSLTDAVFWIDGFKGFTPQEYAVIEKLYTAAGEVNIAVCLDPGYMEMELADDHPFFTTWKTYRDLKDIARAKNVQILEPVLLNPETPPRFTACPDITFLEKNYFNYRSSVYDGPVQNIHIAAAANRRAEVEACARQIIRLARDKGYRWRDTAVMLRDLESYHELISMVFQDHNIPFFIDRKHPVLHHPLVELIRSALEVAVKNWTYEPVFRYFKTDLTPLDREKVFLLENYVLAHGIRGSRWTDDAPWTYRRRYTLEEDSEITEKELAELDIINEARREGIGALVRFTRSVAGAKTAREMTACLYELLDELSIPQQLESWAREAEQAGNLQQSREHAQVWDKVMGLFDEIVESMGDQEMTLETYSLILDAGFESMTMGLIPPGLDQVVVGSLDRSRSPEVRALFILGANEGILPARPSDDGFFTDAEREKLESLGVPIAPGSRRRVFDEQFLVYTALTRAGEQMWISYPVADDEGRSLAPSPVVARIKELFPGIKENYFQVGPVTAEETENCEFLVHPGRALTYLTAKLREAKTGHAIHPIWWELYNRLTRDEWKDMARPLIMSVFYTNSERPIARKTSVSLFGNPVRASVSRIEKFRACPFAHFSLYGLRLKDREMFRLEAPDMGEFFHAALKAFGEELAKRSLDWGEVSPEETAALTEKIIEQLAPRLQSEILLSTARYRYLTGKLKNNIDRAALVLAEHARRSKFRPVGFEVSFGPGGTLPALQLALPGGGAIELSGRIDRIDACEAGDSLYLRVIDYKSSDNNIRLDDIFHGLKLQLLTYLHVVLSHYRAYTNKDIKPGGIFYFTVREPLLPGKGPMSREEVERQIMAKLKMRGFLLADRTVFEMMDNLTQSGYSDLFPVGLKTDGGFYSQSPVIDEKQFASLRNYLEKILMQSGEEILAGNVSIAPYKDRHSSACLYCSFKPVCKFDLLFDDNSYRVLASVDRDEIWDAIEERGD